jgi:hypothetical protein
VTTFANILPAAPVIESYNGQLASAGVNHLIAGVPGKVIAVIGYALQATGTVIANLQDTDGTTRTPPWTFQAREGISRPGISGAYLFGTKQGLGLDLNLTAGVPVNVEIQYVLL